MDPVYFATGAEFTAWLAEHHATAGELWVGYHRKSTRVPSMTWPESVDAALCYGWIDGVRRSVDSERYAIRFTPRRRASQWSAVNVRRVAELTAEGRMQESGLSVFVGRPASAAQGYSYEQQTSTPFDAAAAHEFRAHARAWAFFESQPPSYRRLAAHWVATAKRDDTRRRRLATLIADSAVGRRVAHLAPRR